jgi:small subunit ribosomal protein S9
VAKYTAAIGRRKTAVAIVRLTPGQGDYVINGKSFSDYFPLTSWQERAAAPLRLVGQDKKLDVSVKIVGGGTSSQVDAVRLGIARALVTLNEELKGTLKADGHLTRDSRIKERRKYGLKKARKAPQFSKR